MNQQSHATPSELLARNRAWSEAIRAEDAGFFERLSHQQKPHYLWIGCADSRVPANQIVDLMPGELFVHRNVANVVVPTDLNCLSVMQFAVDVLRVEHIIVCGHYGCGGVAAAYRNDKVGLVENWLRHVQNVRDTHMVRLDRIEAESASIDRLCELNVIEQVFNVGRTTVVSDAWVRGQSISLHGWIYRLDDGIVQDLGVSCASIEDLHAVRNRAVARSDK